MLVNQAPQIARAFTHPCNHWVIKAIFDFEVLNGWQLYVTEMMRCFAYLLMMPGVLVAIMHHGRAWNENQVIAACGLLSGLFHTALHGVYATWVNPDYLDAFATWNANTTSNTLEVARREFSLPGFMDVLVGHQLFLNLVMAWVTCKWHARKA